MWQRKLAWARVVQFNLCKLLICFQFVLTGLVGKHGRKEKKKEGPGAAAKHEEEEIEEIDADLINADGAAACAKRQKMTSTAGG